MSPTTAEDVHLDLGSDVDVILDGGPCMVGVESTIVDCTHNEARVLRLGGITVEQLAGALGYEPAVSEHDTSEIDADDGVRAPGTLAAHYAPHATVELVADDALAGRVRDLRAAGAAVGTLALAQVAVPSDVVALGAPSNVEEYAQLLYQRLRDADRAGLDVLLVVPPPAVGIGAAVCDRLRRAAAGE